MQQHPRPHVCDHCSVRRVFYCMRARRVSRITLVSIAWIRDTITNPGPGWFKAEFEVEPAPHSASLRPRLPWPGRQLPAGVSVAKDQATATCRQPAIGGHMTHCTPGHLDGMRRVCSGCGLQAAWPARMMPLLRRQPMPLPEPQRLALRFLVELFHPCAVRLAAAAAGRALGAGVEGGLDLARLCLQAGE